MASSSELLAIGIVWRFELRCSWAVSSRPVFQWCLCWSRYGTRAGPDTSMRLRPCGPAVRSALGGGWPGLTHSEPAATGQHSEPPSAIPTSDLTRRGPAQPVITVSLSSGGGGQVTGAPGLVREAAEGRRWCLASGRPVPVTLTAAAAAAAAAAARAAAAAAGGELNGGRVCSTWPRQDRSQPGEDDQQSSGTTRGRR